MCHFWEEHRSTMRISLLPIFRAGWTAQTVLWSATNYRGVSYAETPPVMAPPTLLQQRLPPLKKGMRRVYLLRHGETEWNRRGLIQGGGFDIPLNEAGRRQAALAAQQLTDLPIGVVASSHLERAEETANVVAEHFPKAIRVINHKLGEMRFGDFEGTAIKGPESTEENIEKFQAFTDAMHRDKAMAWPGHGGESVVDVQTRARAVLHQLLKDFPDCDHVLLVAHGRFNKILLGHLLDFNENELKQGNTCINVLDVDADAAWHACVLNFTEHTDSESSNNAPS